MNKKKLDKIAETWLRKNGASKIDFKNKEVALWDGGLFGGEVKMKKVPRTKIRFEKIPNSNNSLMVSTKIGGMKNEYYYEGSIWFEDLDGHINYFKRLKKLLNKHGFRTGIGPSRTKK